MSRGAPRCAPSCTSVLKPLNHTLVGAQVSPATSASALGQLAQTASTSSVWRYSTVHHAMKAVLWLLGVSGLISLLVSASFGSPRDPPASVTRVFGRAAYAQTPEVALRYRVVADRSEARYRVREQLAGISFPSDAVGTTSAIEGNLSLDAQGRIRPSDSRFTVDLRTLRSDRDRRDNYVRRNTLETGRHPTAVFIPSEVRGLPFPLPPTGTASFELIGDLTIRATTRRITWEATATFNGQEVSVQAKTSFQFADFGLSIPRVASVLSVEETIRLETDLLLRRGS
jgi:polyisoprenoid-binding protein YceI